MPHPTARPVLRLALTLAAAFACAASVASALAADAPPAKPTTHLKEETRLPWSRSNERFIRHWQVLGEVPLAASPGAFTQDPFVANGGEAALAPGATSSPKLPDGTALTWRAVTAWGDATDLSDGNGLKRDLAAYAATTVTRTVAGKARLCLGSDESLRAWVNGALVLEHRGPRSLSFDEDQVEVDLKAGDNLLLVKVEQRTGPWNFAARVLESGAVPPRAREIGPSLIEESPTALLLKTDVNRDHASEAKVTVQVVAAGGKILADQTAARGDSVRLDAAGWPDGPYEIRCITAKPDGLLVATHLPWYKGDAIAAARELVAAAAKADVSTPTGQTIKMLGDMILDHLDKDGLAITGNPWWLIHSPLLEFAELQLEAAGDKAARDRSYGFVRLAWRDDVDGSPQFARAYLPGGYDRAKKWPLVLKLHGYNPPNPEYVRWWAADGRHGLADTEYAHHQGIIYLEPHGRGNTQYIGFGDADVVRAIQFAKERFNVDEDRIYLCGESMGGWGTWFVGTRHPDLFAAIAPIFGGVDYHSYLTEEQLAALNPVTRFLQEMNSVWASAEGLLHTPIYVLHGDVDQAVNVDWSRYGVKLLQRWGYNIRYDEMPGYGHEDLNRFDKLFNWFLEQRRVTNPRHVRLRTAELRNASAYWAAIEQFERPDDFMLLDAEVIAPNTIRVDSQNVLALTLTPGAALVDAAQPVKIVWNGIAQNAALRDGRLELRAAELARSPASAAPVKNAQVAGPLGDIYSTPFAIVVGTSSADPAMNAVCQQKADALVAFWKDWQRQPPRVFKDTALSDADAARYSLLLIGGADANSITRKFADQIPLSITADHIAIGGRSFAATGAHVQLIRPNPLNPQRYVFVVGATSAAALRFWTPANLRGAEFDYAIEDTHVANVGQTADRTDLWIAGGWFDRSWQFDPAFLHEGSTPARAQAIVLGGDLDPKLLGAYVGRYEVAPGTTITVTLAGPRLSARVGESPLMDMIPAGGDRFYIAEGPAVVLFEKDASGKVVSFKSSQAGQEFSGKRVE